MKQLTAEQIQENWNKLIQLIKDTFPEDYPDNRREKLLKMYHHFEDRMTVAPASGKEHYHNAHVGGYVEHVLHVTDLAVQIKELWVKNNATINFPDSMLPTRWSRCKVKAAPSVIACNASCTSIRSLGPRIRPLAVCRLTAHQAVNRGSRGVTGASEWIV